MRRPALVLIALAAVACDIGEKSAPQGAGGSGSTSMSTSTPGLGGSAPVAGTVTISATGATPIPKTAFGQNYWSSEPAYGDPIAGTAGLAAGMRFAFLRAGGDSNDSEMPGPFTNADIDAFVAYARQVGAEPDLQVPILFDASGNPATAQTAADMVTYANKTMGYGVKYWSIGNEPDIYPTTTGLPASYSSYTAADYCATFKQYAAAMKAVDPTIVLLGPELSYSYVPGNDWLNPFLDGCASVVDIVSVHRYPLAPDMTTVEAAFADAASFRSLAQSLRADLVQHGIGSTPLAITEANITWDGTPSKSTMPASPSTWFAGLWAADVTGVALEQGLFTNAFWHVADSASGWKLAFILAGKPVPAYHAVSLFAERFTGDALVVSGVPDGFSVYASRDTTTGTAVMVLNKTTAAAALTLSFADLPPQTLSLEAQSQAALVIPAGMGAPQVFRYTQALAAAGMGPVKDP